MNGRIKCDICGEQHGSMVRCQRGKDMGMCNKELRVRGLPYPRTCAVCGLGKCTVHPEAVTSTSSAAAKMPEAEMYALVGKAYNAAHDGQGYSEEAFLQDEQALLEIAAKLRGAK